jgi:hypothetical protein
MGYTKHMHGGKLGRFGRGLLLFLLTVTFAPIGPSVSAASSPFNLTASPLPVNLVTTPGNSVSTPIQIENTGTQTVKIKVQLLKFGAFGNDGKPSITEPDSHDTFISWVHFSETSFIAPPNVFHSITMTIKPPKDAAFGYYYAVIFSVDNGKNDAPSTPRENKVNGALATLVLVDVQAPGENRVLRVSNFTASKKLYQYLPATFTIAVKNTGNVHGIPTGNIYISKHKGGSIIDILDVNKDQGNVLPGSDRSFQSAWSDGFPVYQTKRLNEQIISDNRGHPIQQLNWDSSKFSRLRFGHYFAHLTLVYSDGSKDIPIEADTSFWVIPWGLILIILIPLIIIGFGLFVIIRSFLRQTKKQTKKLHHKEYINRDRSRRL